MGARIAKFAVGVFSALQIASLSSCSSEEVAGTATDASAPDAADAHSEGNAGTGGTPSDAGHDATTDGSGGSGGTDGGSDTGTPDTGGAAGVGGAAGAGGDPNFTPDGCYRWPGTSGLSLQSATSQHDCVEVQQGSHSLDAPVALAPGHTLRGVSASESILVANQAAWSFACCDSMITDTMPATPEVDPFQVKTITLDGAGVATYNVCCRGYVADGVVMIRSRCSAIGIADKGVTARNCTMRDSAQHTVVPGLGTVTCATGGTGGVDEGAAIYSQGTASDFGSLIEGNHIENSFGPALDINGAWGGTFRGNIVSGNSAWAAVSLYGASNWVIENNQISHPGGEPPQPYHPYCANGPAGGHSAGIFLCQDTDAGNLVTNGNIIRGNTTSSFYGILSVGADEIQPYFAPRNNTFENNDVFGSNLGCADDFAPGQWMSDANTWTGNNCAGAPDTGPTTF